MFWKKLKKGGNRKSEPVPQPGTSQVKVGEIKPARPIFRLGNKKFILLILAVLALSSAGYLLYKQYMSSDKVNYDDTVAYTINGEALNIPKEFINVGNADNGRPSAKSPQDSIDELESEIAAGETYYQNYVYLAELYLGIDNKEKALENYKHARDAFVSSDEYNLAKVKSFDASIEKLESELKR